MNVVLRVNSFAVKAFDATARTSYVGLDDTTWNLQTANGRGRAAEYFTWITATRICFKIFFRSQLAKDIIQNIMFCGGNGECAQGSRAALLCCAYRTAHAVA